MKTVKEKERDLYTELRRIKDGQECDHTAFVILIRIDGKLVCKWCGE